MNKRYDPHAFDEALDKVVTRVGENIRRAYEVGQKLNRKAARRWLARQKEIAAQADYEDEVAELENDENSQD